MEISSGALKPSSFLLGGGEMGELTRNYDWSKTPLGRPEQWPQSLRTTVGNLLRSGFPMFLWWGDDLIQFYNDAYRPSLGNDCKHPAALGQKGIDCWPEIWDTIFPLIQKVKATGEPTWHQDRLIPIYRNGRLEDVYWTFSYSLVLDDDDKSAGILVTCLETTKTIQDRIDQSQHDFIALFEESPVGIASINSGDDLVFESANLFYCVLVGRAPEELTGKPLLEALPELKDQGFDILLKNVISTGIPYIAEEIAVDIFRAGKLQTIYVNLAYQPRRNAGGQVNGVLVIATDITQQVITRKQIQESEQQIRSLIESAPFPIGVFTGQELKIIFANEAILKAWGKGPDVIGKLFTEILPELAGQEIFEQLGSVITTGLAFHAKNQRVDLLRDGKLQPYYFNYSFTPLYDAEGTVYGVMNTAADVTDLNAAHQKIEQSEKNFRNMILQSPVAMCILMGPEHIVDIANDAMIELWGKPKEAVMHRTVFEGLPEAREQGLELLLSDVITTGIAFKAEERPVALLRNGKMETVYQNFVYEPYKDSSGNTLGVLAISVDVSSQVIARRKIEEVVMQRTAELAEANDALRNSNKELQRSNANLEEFAHAASHDLKEPIRKIHFFTHQLKEALNEHLKENELRAFSRIENATKRMGNLIDDLLLYSHVSQRPHETEEIDLNLKVQRVLEDLELDIAEKKASVHVAMLPVVKGYRRQLQQLFQNLISNALKYSKTNERPRIEITAGTFREGERTYHRIAVKDNGIGFEQQYADKIFQMFSRLHGKAEYSGTGVGLSIVKKVVENHNGFINVKSAPGEGSTFTVYLPA